MTRPTPLATALCLALAITACETPRQHKAAEDAAIKKQAAEEITRICDLHGPEREAQLKKLKDASGMELYCSH